MKELHKQWSSIFIRGIFALLFGFVAIFWPGVGLEVLVLLFGAYALIDGFIAFFVAFPARSIWLMIEGIIGVLVGLYIFFYTVQAIAIFILLVGIWAIATGIFELIAAVELRRYIKNEFWLLFTAVVSILFGILVFVNPVLAGITFTIVIGFYAFVFGIMLMALGMSLKNYRVSSPSKKKKKR